MTATGANQQLKTPTMIDSILSDLANLGWLLNNCYQIDATLWRVNLRRPTPDGNYFTDWAEAPTFLEALEDCMTKLNDAEFTEIQAQTYSTEPAKPKLNPRNLLASLGLTRPSQPFNRRI